MRRRALLAAALLALPRAGRAAGRRIVVVGGALTEIAFALGQGDAVVAVDSTSLFPGQAADLPRIGYMRAIPPEGILSLHPDLLVLSSEAGPPDAVAVLQAARLPIAVVEDKAGPAAVVAKIQAMAAALGADGATLARDFAADASALDAAIAAMRHPRALFVLSLSGGAPAVAGRGTHTGAMLEWAGATNAVTAFQGYRPLSAESAMEAGPEAIVMMQHALAEAGGADAVFATPQLRFTPAAQGRRVIGIDGTYAFGWGPRAAHARRDLAAALGAESLPALPKRAWT